MDRIGQQLGNYTLFRLLGRGSEADVYLGRYLQSGKLAAIKVLSRHSENDGAERFRREACIVGALKHPHIVHMLASHKEHHPPYIVLGYLAGGTLRQRYPRGSVVPLDTVVRYVTQLADALQYVHDLGVIHRDIKPENILLDGRYRLFLSDFGLAIPISQICQQQIPYMHSAQGVAGTLSYMAPEQLQSHAVQASDQYSLAIMVYELLCGERPFQGAVAEMLVKQMTICPPSLRMKNSAIPPGVENVVMKALEKDPEKRFRSVREFAQALALAARAEFVAGQKESVYKCISSDSETTSCRKDDGLYLSEMARMPPKQLDKALAIAKQVGRRAESKTLPESASTIYSPQDASDLCGRL